MFIKEGEEKEMEDSGRKLKHRASLYRKHRKDGNHLFIFFLLGYAGNTALGKSRMFENILFGIFWEHIMEPSWTHFKELFSLALFF